MRKKRKSALNKDLNIKNRKAYGTEASIKLYDSHKGKILESEKKLIKEYFKGKILDLGCGCGRTTKYLSDKKYNVVGVDITKGMINLAKKRYPKINFQVGDACELNFPDKTFDVVFFSYNGLDYIYPEEKRILAIKEISRVLKGEGIFIYSSHNPKALLQQFRPRFILRNLLGGFLFSKYKDEKQNFGHLYTYYASPEQQKFLVEKNTPMKLFNMCLNTKDPLHPHYVFKKQKGKLKHNGRKRNRQKKSKI